MPRETLLLDGAWDFRMEDADGAPGDWRKMEVPRPWQSAADDLRYLSGTGIYRRGLRVPAHWAGDEAVLRFGAVNYFAEVLLDGELLLEHEGGWLPFEAKLPQRVLDGAGRPRDGARG